MIIYFSTQFQAIPGLVAIKKRAHGHLVTTRLSTLRAINSFDPKLSKDTYLYVKKLGQFSKGYKKLKAARKLITGAAYKSTLSEFVAEKSLIFTGTYATLSSGGIEKTYSHFDEICTIGPRMTNLFRHTKLNDRVIETGYFPFLDFPTKTNDYKVQISQFLDLDPNKKILVYFPTGEPFGSLEILLPIFLKYIPPSEFNLIIRPHPSQSIKKSLRNLISYFMMSSNINKFRNIKIDLNNFKSSHLLSIADLIISDGNSIAEEALYYDTPQLILQTHRMSKDMLWHNLELKNSSNDEIDKSLLFYNNGYNLNLIKENPEKLINVIERCISDDLFSTNRKYNYEMIFTNKNHFSQLNYISELNHVI